MVRNGLLNRLQEQLRRLAKSSRSSRTRRLADVVAQAIGARTRGDWRQDPAARTFQALRIAVNRELHEVSRRAAAADRHASRPAAGSPSISFHSLEDRIVKRFFAVASQPVRRRRAARAHADQRGGAAAARRSRLVGRAIKPSAAEVARNPRARSAVLRVAERTHASAAGRLAARMPETRAMTRVNVLLLCVLVVLRAVARHVAPPGAQAVRRARARAGARAALRRRVRPAVSSSSRRGAMPARVEKIAREPLRMQLPGVVARRSRRSAGAAGDAMKADARRCAAPAATRVARRPRSCRGSRAPLLFGGARARCSPVLLGRSLYLQWIDNEFLQAQGAARFSREIEVPAHRGRIVDRFGEPLAMSTPVKSLWAFRDKFDATPDAARASSRACSRRRRSSFDAQLDAATAISRSSRSSSRPRPRERAMALAHQGPARAERIPPLLSRRRSDGADLGFTGDQDAGQEGIELAQQAWLAGTPGSRRVIINRRGDIVEDVAAIRAPQAGRDLALVDRLAAAVPRVPRAQGGGRAQQGEGGRPRRPRRARAARSSRSPTGRRTTRTAATGSRASGCATARSPTRSSRARR